MNTISDPNCNGMYLSFLNAYSNIPSLTFNPLFVRLLDFGPVIPSIIILILTLAYSWTILPKLTQKLSLMTPKAFHLTSQKTS